MTNSIKLTVPALERIAQIQDDFLVQISHAAAKEISERHSKTIIDSAVVQDALNKVHSSIESARNEAGQILAAKIGEWDNTSWGSKYKLRSDVAKYINDHFMLLLRQEFDKWVSSLDLDKLFAELAKDYITKRFDEVLRQELGDFLKRR